MTKLLLIVDPQYDFVEGGLLPVEGGRKAMETLAEHITNNGSQYEAIIATADWHPITHMSFNKNGGEWPIHCVQFTKGAAIYQDVINAMETSQKHFEVLTKGTNEDREEYSIFKNETSSKALKRLIEELKIDEVDVAGIAGDICVLNTIKDGLRELPDIRFSVLESCIASLDGGKAIHYFVEAFDRVKFN